MESKYIAFWNVENLFDIKNSPRRSEKLQRTIGGELAGWTQNILNKKIAQLAKVITSMNEGKGPDILGVCEVENAHVLELLAAAISQNGAAYNVVHHDGSDKRGIDVAFFVREGDFDIGPIFSHEILKRSATRDLLQVNLNIGEKKLVLIGNHWPARSGGRYMSEPYRIIAAETLSYFHERIHSIYGKDVAVLAMGDFNDEPCDRSLTEYALAERSVTKVLNARSPKFYNAMWGILGAGDATHYYDNAPNVLDQILISKGLLSGASGIKANLDSVKIIKHPDMISGGKYPAPIRFGRKNKMNVKGYSDHFPICIKIEIGDE